MEYNTKSEDVVKLEATLSDDHLKSLDKELAPYPFEGMDTWKSLTGFINDDILDYVISDGRVDGMTQVEGEEEAGSFDQGKRLRFPQFDLKRSWREGAVGEEITRYSRDKSWLLSNVIGDKGDRLYNKSKTDLRPIDTSRLSAIILHPPSVHFFLLVFSSL